MYRLDYIPVNLEPGEIRRNLRIRRPIEWERVEPLIETVKPLIRAKAVFGVGYIEEKLEDGVIIDGTRFKSKVLRKNLENVGRVFPYVVTIGGGVEEKIRTCKDILEKYNLDGIGNTSLIRARKHLEDHLRTRFALKGLSFMSPGSLKDWPIEEQRPLFSILGDVESVIGVRLNENLLMIPTKSVSGIYFPTETTFYSCQLCPRERCEGRKARYDESLARHYGVLEPGPP
jgi:hypothetical protein